MAQSLNDFSEEIHRGEHFRTSIRSTDSFDKKIADGTRTELDIPSQYPFTPERLHLFRNGSRAFPHYNSVSQFNDINDVWQLQPDSGDTMHIESAESLTYTVGYVMSTTFAFNINQSLQVGDKIRFGPFDGTDGWLFEQRGGDHNDNEGDIIVSIGGSEETLESNVILPQPITDYCRYEVQYNWYAVGHQTWKQTYTENGRQYNELFAKTSKDSGRGPQSGNMNLWVEVQAGASTSGLQINCGSMSGLTLGNVTSLNRLKQQEENITLPSENDNTWVPLLAMRIDPDKSNVNAELNGVSVEQYSNNADCEMMVVSVDKGKTNASGFSTPDFHHSYNTAIQTTDSITEIPRASDGTQKVLDNTEKPGGHTLASSVLLTGGGGSESSRISQNVEEVKKSVLTSDHTVFCARSSNSGGDVDFAWESDQLW